MKSLILLCSLLACAPVVHGQVESSNRTSLKAVENVRTALGYIDEDVELGVTLKEYNGIVSAVAREVMPLLPQCGKQGPRFEKALNAYWAARMLWGLGDIALANNGKVEQYLPRANEILAPFDLKVELDKDPRKRPTKFGRDSYKALVEAPRSALWRVAREQFKVQDKAKT